MLINKTEYREIPGYPGYYAGYDGTIYSTKSDKCLTPMISEKGYLQVTLMTTNHKQHSKRVNRLVAMSWLPNPDNKPEVHHKNENKVDNSVENLAWVTSLENNNAGTHNQRISKTQRNDPKRSKPVVLTNIVDGSKLYFVSAMEARRTGYRVDSVLSGKNKTVKGYTVKYVN